MINQTNSYNTLNQGVLPFFISDCLEKDKFPNLIFTTWETVDRPRQVIVSDMTAFKFWILYFEVTFYFDVFTKESLQITQSMNL